ncbi:MAG TPA: hypothetical protein VJZ05_00975 [Bacilli bacterium]|nr:hypothetical protein [Bacilli bacterium]
MRGQNLSDYTTKRKKRLQNTLIRNFLLGSSALVVTGVVVPEILAKPEAEFITLYNQGTTISYTVDIRDPNNRLVPNSLRLELESYDGAKYYSLDLGENTNSIPNLLRGNKYTLKVLGNYGFGLGSLVEKSIRISNELQAGFQAISHASDAIYGELYVSDEEQKITDNNVEISLYSGSGLLSAQTITLFSGFTEDQVRYQVINFSFPISDPTRPYRLEAHYNVERFPVTIATATLDPEEYIPSVEIYAESYQGQGLFIGVDIYDGLLRLTNPIFRVELLQIGDRPQTLFSEDYPQVSAESESPGMYYIYVDYFEPLPIGDYRVNVYLRENNQSKLLAQKEFSTSDFIEPYMPSTSFQVFSENNDLVGEIQITDYEYQLLANQEFQLAIESSYTYQQVFLQIYTLERSIDGIYFLSFVATNLPSDYYALEVSYWLDGEYVPFGYFYYDHQVAPYVPMGTMTFVDDVNGPYLTVDIYDEQQLVNPLFRVEIFDLNNANALAFSQDYPQTSGTGITSYYFEIQLINYLFPSNFRAQLSFVQAPDVFLMHEISFIINQPQAL